MILLLIGPWTSLDLIVYQGYGRAAFDIIITVSSSCCEKGREGGCAGTVVPPCVSDFGHGSIRDKRELVRPTNRVAKPTTMDDSGLPCWKASWKPWQNKEKVWWKAWWKPW